MVRRLGACVLVAVTLGAAAGCRRRQAAPAETGDQPLAVAIEVARQQTLRVTVSGTGVVVPSAAGDLTIYPAQSGRILELPKKEGDAVAVGDVLVRFEYGTTGTDLSAHEMELASAQTRVDAARAQLKKVTAMHDLGYTSKNELEAATNAVTAAELDVTRVKAEIQSSTEAAERAIVKARFPGVVAKIFHNEGDLVNATVVDPVLRVIDPSRLEVAMAVPVQDLPQVEAGQAATIVSANGAEPGTVLMRPTVDDPRAATADVRIAFRSPTTLAVDSPVQAEILVAERPDVIAIPKTALIAGDDGQTFVLIAGVDGRAHRRGVHVGMRSRDRVEIIAGVTAGDRVIVNDPADIAEATPVSVG
jgi:RND family efflux transporter MFP subunit